MHDYLNLSWGRLYYNWLKSPSQRLEQQGRVVCRKGVFPGEEAMRVRLYGGEEMENLTMDDLWIPHQGLIITTDCCFAADSTPPPGIRVQWIGEAKDILVANIDGRIEELMRLEIPELLPEASADPEAERVAKTSFVTGLDHARKPYTLAEDPMWNKMSWADYVSFYDSRARRDTYVRRMADKWMAPDDNFAYAVKTRLCEIQADAIMQAVQENPDHPWHLLRELWKATKQAGWTLLATFADADGHEKERRIRTDRFRSQLLGEKDGLDPMAVTKLKFGGCTLFSAAKECSAAKTTNPDPQPLPETTAYEADLSDADAAQAVLDVCKAGSAADTRWLRCTLAKLADDLLSRCAAHADAQQDFGRIHLAAASEFGDTGCIRSLPDYLRQS